MLLALACGNGFAVICSSESVSSDGKVGDEQRWRFSRVQRADEVSKHIYVLSIHATRGKLIRGYRARTVALIGGRYRPPILRI